MAPPGPPGEPVCRFGAASRADRLPSTCFAYRTIRWLSTATSGPGKDDGRRRSAPRRTRVRPRPCLADPRPDPVSDGVGRDMLSAIAYGLRISLFPGVALLVTIVSINLVGDRLRDVLNPRLDR